MPRNVTSKPNVGSLKKIWTSTLERAQKPFFPVYELRHTFATRLSAGGFADHFVMLRQGDSQVLSATAKPSST